MRKRKAKTERIAVVPGGRDKKSVKVANLPPQSSPKPTDVYHFAFSK